MDVCVASPDTNDGRRPGPVARVAEERGQQVLYLAEHTHDLRTELGRAAGKLLAVVACSRRIGPGLPFGSPGRTKGPADAWESAIADCDAK